MNQIDFYLLPEAMTAPEFVCRLTEKAYRRGHQIFIYTNEELASKLDDLLWTFRADSFLPHHGLNSTESAPILISTQAPTANFNDILINLTEAQPDFYQQFQRTLIIVPHQNRESSRNQYRYFQQQGCKINLHNL